MSEAVQRWLSAFGVDYWRAIRALRTLPSVISDYSHFKSQLQLEGARQRLSFTFPCLDDKYSQSGTASGHYFHQDLFVARKIFQRGPRRHVDVGSRVDGFVAHVAVFRNIDVLDVRPQTANIINITFRQFDIMSSTLAPDLVECCDSLSCLHALEHFGLGRYGDSIDVNGHIKGLKILTRMLQPTGILYLAVPIGDERIEFNAHRVFNVGTILDLVTKDFELEAFSYVSDDGSFHENAAMTEERAHRNFGCRYGCGIFELKKK